MKEKLKARFSKDQDPGCFLEIPVGHTNDLKAQSSTGTAPSVFHLSVPPLKAQIPGREPLIGFTFVTRPLLGQEREVTLMGSLFMEISKVQL